MACIDHCLVDDNVGGSFFTENINHQLIVDLLEIGDLLLTLMALGRKYSSLLCTRLKASPQDTAVPLDFGQRAEQLQR